MSSGRRLGATVRFLLADLLSAQRVLVPALLFLAVLGVVVAGDHTLAPGPWTASVLLLYPAAAWIGLSAANVEDPEQRRVTVAAAGGPGPVTVATSLSALVVTLVLVAAAVLLPALLDPTGFPLPSVAAAALAHLAVACSGVALGTVCARPVVARVGWSFALLTGIVLVTVGQTWLPPVGVAAEALTAASPSHATSTLPVLGAVTGLGASLLVLAGVVSWSIARRA